MVDYNVLTCAFLNPSLYNVCWYFGNISVETWDLWTQFILIVHCRNGFNKNVLIKLEKKQSSGVK